MKVEEEEIKIFRVLGSMADDASVEQFTINRFYCHQCLAEISRVLPDYKCPTCQSGFIEALEAPPEVEDDSESEMNDSQPYDVLMRALMGLPHRRSGRHGRNQRMAPIDTLIQDFVVNVTGRAGWSGHGVGVRGGANGPVPAASPNTLAPDSPASPILSFHWSTNLGQDTFPPSSPHDHLPSLPAFLLNLLRNLDLNTTELPDILQGWFLGNPGDYAWGREGLDAIVTQLLNQMDGTGPPPLAQDKIQQIPVVSITDDHVGVSLQCSVCWEDFKVGEPVRKLACEHVYHEPCIIPWLELHGTCPICRKTLDGDVDPNSASSSDGPLVAFLRAQHANTTSDASNRAASTSSDSSSTSSSSRSTSSRPDFNMDFD